MSEHIGSRGSARSQARRGRRGGIAAKLTGSLEDVDERVTISAIILAFWGMFWTLHGFDRLFSVDQIYAAGQGGAGDLRWLLSLPGNAVTSVLYAISGVEIMLGLGFLYTLFFAKRDGALSTLTFRASLLLFLCFALGSMLAGDGAELGRHGSFLALVIVSALSYRPQKQEADGAA